MSRRTRTRRHFNMLVPGCRRTWIVAACCGALFVPMLLPLLLGRVLTRDDLAAMHLPFRFLYRNALRDGDSFLWMPAMRSGLFLHGEGEGGFAHPLHLFLYRFLPLGAALNIEIAATYAAMLAGGSVLLRRLGFAIDAALFGALVFAFGGFNLFNLPRVNHVAAIAHLPWILFFAHVLLTTTDRRHRAAAFAGCALAVGSQLLVGNPQYVWLTGLALAFMTVCVAYANAVSRLVLLGGAFIAGVLIGAVQLLPTLDFIRESTRRTWTVAESLTFSLSPLNLVQLWAPFAFRFRVYAPLSEVQMVHEFVVYNGAFCTVALAWLALRWRVLSRQRFALALLALAVLSLVLAFGRYGGIYPLLAQLPVLRNFRAPARHILLFQLALAGLAAIAYEDLSRLVARGERLAVVTLWPLAIPVALSVITIGIGSALAGSKWAASREMLLSGLMRAAPWSLVIIVMSALIALAARSARWALPAIVICTTIDLGLWGFLYVYRWGPMRSVDELAAIAEVPRAASPGELIVPMSGGAPVNLALLRGIRLQTGYFGLETSSVLDSDDPVTLRIAGARWRPDGTHWAAVSDTMPRARLVSRAQVSSNIRQDVHRTDIATVALVDRSVALSGTRGTAQLVDDRPGDITIDTASDGEQLLIVTERFHPGWQASQDGVRREVTAVYGDYLGCLVDGGRHRVNLRFDPPSVRNGLRTTFAGLVLTIAAAATLW